jgi:hypothetical protein
MPVFIERDGTDPLDPIPLIGIHADIGTPGEVIGRDFVPVRARAGRSARLFLSLTSPLDIGVRARTGVPALLRTNLGLTVDVRRANGVFGLIAIVDVP